MEINVKEIFETLNGYLPKLINASEQIGYHIQSNNDVEAVELLQEFIDGLNWVISVVTHLNRLGYEINIDSNSLNEYLLQIENAIQSKDSVLISDLFEYEIAPILTDWLEKIDNQLNGGTI